MIVTQLRADDERFHGLVMGRELLDLLKMLHRICASGVLHLDAERNRGSVCLDGGAICAAFFNELSGAQALSRIIMISRANFRFELATAHTVVGYARNIAKDTALILSTVEAMMDGAESAPSSVTQTAAIPDSVTNSATAPSAADNPIVTTTYRATEAGISSGMSPSIVAHVPVIHDAGESSTIRVAAFSPPEPGTVLGK